MPLMLMAAMLLLLIGCAFFRATVKGASAALHHPIGRRRAGVHVLSCVSAALSKVMMMCLLLPTLLLRRGC
jgi:hypothetical protein